MNIRNLLAIVVVLLLRTVPPTQPVQQTAKSSPGCEGAATTAEMRSCENTRYEKADRDPAY